MLPDLFFKSKSPLLLLSLSSSVLIVSNGINETDIWYFCPLFFEIEIESKLTWADVCQKLSTWMDGSCWHNNKNDDQDQYHDEDDADRCRSTRQSLIRESQPVSQRRDLIDWSIDRWIGCCRWLLLSVVDGLSVDRQRLESQMISFFPIFFCFSTLVLILVMVMVLVMFSNGYEESDGTFDFQWEWSIIGKWAKLTRRLRLKLDSIRYCRYDE